MHPNDGRILSNLIVQALRGKNIIIYEDGFQTKSFCYVDDLIDAIIRKITDVGFTAPFNIGNQGEFSMLKLAELLLKPSGSKSKIIYLPL
jgi:UDP-glucuronate decarboxylase